MLAPSNRRTASFECIEDGVLLTVTYQQVEELYFQNPEFGFFFLRLSTARLFDNISRLENQARQQPAAQGVSYLDPSSFARQKPSKHACHKLTSVGRGGQRRSESGRQA